MTTIIEFLFLPTKVIFQAFSAGKSLARKSASCSCGPLSGTGIRYVLSAVKLGDVDSASAADAVLSLCREFPQKLSPAFLVFDGNGAPTQQDAFIQEAFQRLPLLLLEGATPGVAVDRITSSQLGDTTEQPSGIELLSVAVGELFSLPRQRKLTAVDDSILAVPMRVFDGLVEKKIGAIIHPDADVKMGMNQGPPHPVLGPCILIALTAGKSVWLSRDSQVTISNPAGNASGLRFQLATNVA